MAGGKPPLDGIRVLDLGRHQAGPRCAQVLARLGAEVIKIERLEGEETRQHGPWSNGQSAYFVQYNSGAYPCKDGWVLISAGDQHQWPRVCRALNKPEWLDDPRFTQRHLRQENGAVIGEAVVALLAEMTMQEAITHFTEHDITAAPVNTVAQAAADPHPWERRVMVEVPDPIAGTIPVSSDFWHFSRSEAVGGSTPTVGQHTDELLGNLLHYTPEQLAELREARVIT